MKNNFSIFYILEAIGLTQKKIFHSVKKRKFLLQTMKITKKNILLNPINNINESNLG